MPRNTGQRLLVAPTNAPKTREHVADHDAKPPRNGQAADLSQGQCRRASLRDLCVNAALPDRVCDAVNRQHIGGDAVVDVVSFSVAYDVVE